MRWGRDNTSFLDLILNLLMGVLVLLTIAIIHITVENQKANIEQKAEIVMTVDWDQEYNHDVDSWIESPTGEIVWFKDKEGTVVHLDRDDLGHTNDMGRYTHKPNPNQEIATWRGYEPGEWVINMHFYRPALYGQPGHGCPATVRVKIIKLNPKAVTIVDRTVVLEKKGDQETIARILVSNIGDVISVDDGPFKDLAGKYLESIGQGGL